MKGLTDKNTTDISTINTKLGNVGRVYYNKVSGFELPPREYTNVISVDVPAGWYLGILTVEQQGTINTGNRIFSFFGINKINCGRMCVPNDSKFISNNVYPFSVSGDTTIYGVVYNEHPTEVRAIWVTLWVVKLM